MLLDKVIPNKPLSIEVATSTSRSGTFSFTCPSITRITFPVSFSVTSISFSPKKVNEVVMFKGLSLIFSTTRLGSFITGPNGDAGALKYAPYDRKLLDNKQLNETNINKKTNIVTDNIDFFIVLSVNEMRDKLLSLYVIVDERG